ncbi:hypothetical protein [Candidatus Binatus sp.]|uniref:hypothetical protein n=1 Tax=Candidatus Binatus sp. TaxID=2811406 RepID=UPI002F94A56F
MLALDHLIRRDPRAFDRRGRIPDAPIVAYCTIEDCGGRRQYFVDGLCGKPFPLRRLLGCVLLGDIFEQSIADGFDLADRNLIHSQAV